jgi:hypothetical protein
VKWVLWCILAVLCRGAVAEEVVRQPGLRAEWHTNASHASKLGHIDWEAPDRTSIEPWVYFPSTSGAFYSGGPSDAFGARLFGSLQVPSDGVWGLRLVSDQGAQVWVDGELVINDGDGHSARSRSAQVSLDEGYHDIEVRCWDGWGDAALELYWSGPGVAEEVVPPGAFSYTGEEAAYDPGGDGLWAYWYRDARHASNVGQMDWSDPDRVDTVQRVAFPLTSGAFAPTEPSDSAAVRLVGVLDVPEAGVWRFELGSDQSGMLLIDGVVVVADTEGHSFRWGSGTVELDAGEHAVEVRHWEGWGDAGLFLVWQGPSDEHPSVVPSSRLRPGSGAVNPGAGGGLTVYWYDDARHASGVGQVDWRQHDSVGTVDRVYWPVTAGGFRDGGPTDSFATRLVGFIDVPSSGVWSFGLGSDQSARLLIDGRVVINDSSGHSYRWTRGSVSLSAGRHAVEVQQWEGWGDAGLVLTWRAPGEAYDEVVPASAFSPEEPDPDGPVIGGLRAYWVDDARHASKVGHIDFAVYDESTVVENIAWGLTSGAFRSGGPRDSFGVRLVGRVTVEEAGEWGFRLGSDQSAQLFIDGELVISDDAGHSYQSVSATLNLTEGDHDIEVRFWEGWGDAGLVLSWTPPGGVEVVVPSSAFSTPATETPYDAGGGGLRAYWGENARHAGNVGQIDWLSNDSVTTVDNIAWALTSGGFGEGLPADSFALRLLGRIEIPATGEWTFSLGSDQSAMLLIDGEPVVVDASGHSYRWATGAVALEAGLHDIEVRFWEGWGDAGLNLAWRGPGVEDDIIVPRSAFSLRETESPYEPGGGIRAYWTSNARHAGQAGQIDHAEADSTTVVENISWTLTDGGFYSGGPSDSFGARFVSRIWIPEDGLWTFKLGSDQSAVMLIDDRPVVVDVSGHSYRWQSGTVELTAGEHRFEVWYWDGWGKAGLHATWQGPGWPVEEVIPPSAFEVYETDPGLDCNSAGLSAAWLDGLSGTSFASIDWEDSDPMVTRESRVSWNLTSGSFVEGVRSDSFAVRLTGRVSVTESGIWTFNLGTDQYGELLVDGEVVVSDASGHSFRWQSGSVELDAGEHDIEITMMDGWGEAGLFLTWRGPSDQFERVIPACAFVERAARRVVRWREVSPVGE